MNTDKFKSEIDITEVISGYIEVKKNVALCPFHSEKTPSFSISQNKQIYHCFGCGASGDVIEFVKQYEGVNFIDAIKILGGDIEATKMEARPPPIKKEVKPNGFSGDLLRQHIADMHYADKKPLYDYFASRGIKNIELSNDIGFLENCRYDQHSNYPAIFALVRDVDGNIVSGHRTFLKNGKAFHRGLMPSIVPGISNGCHIRLINADNQVLFAGEGMETVLSVLILNGKKEANYWSAINSNGLGGLFIPSKYKDITICADVDHSMAGQKAANKIKSRYDCQVIYPCKLSDVKENAKGFDFNDLLCEY